MHAYRKWVPPVATRIPDIHGWMQDIASARDIAVRLTKEAESEPPDPVLLDAMSTSAVVRYSRCFTTGSRERLHIKQLSSADSTEIALHDRIRGIRDWHVAHPVNQQEVHALYIIVDEAPGAKTQALGFSSFSSVQLPLRPFEAVQLVTLCSKWIDWLNIQLVQENLRLMPHANLLSREAILALPQDEPRPDENIRARRTQRHA